MLMHEHKLMKINAPAIVVGDLQGNLTDLIQLEKLFFQSFPICPESLIFLGNYSGDCGYGIECLVYLFALKLCSPNKVFLLRGAHEASVSSSESLHKECTRKYGPGNGKLVHDMMIEIFARLPIALLVDDSILCTHSGIPTTSRLSRLYTLPKEMRSLERDGPSTLAHQVSYD